MTNNDEYSKLRAKCIKLANESEKYKKEINRLKTRIKELEISIEIIKNSVILFDLTSKI